jgi:hypothetical protein
VTIEQSQQPAASSQQPAASSQQPAASSQQPAASSHLPFCFTKNPLSKMAMLKSASFSKYENDKK